MNCWHPSNEPLSGRYGDHPDWVMFLGAGSEHSTVLSNGDIAQIQREYVVLLRDGGETSAIYALAAPKLSVFDLSHYDEIKALIA
ncbi:MAG: hypothetical protein J6X47_02575 [Clostridia bacterium]|nr:hypothetical protein [Clostridia bacterium]